MLQRPLKPATEIDVKVPGRAFLANVTWPNPGKTPSCCDENWPKSGDNFFANLDNVKRHWRQFLGSRYKKEEKKKLTAVLRYNHKTIWGNIFRSICIPKSLALFYVGRPFKVMICQKGSLIFLVEDFSFLFKCPTVILNVRLSWHQCKVPMNDQTTQRTACAHVWPPSTSF